MAQTPYTKKYTNADYYTDGKFNEDVAKKAFLDMFEHYGIPFTPFLEENFWVTDIETMAVRLIEVLVNGYEDKLTGRYKLKNIDDIHSVMPWEILEEIGRERGMLIRGGEVNTERASVMPLDEYRGGKMGKISFERPPKF